MAAPGDVLFQLRDVTQEYGALRPLRIKALDLRAGQRLAILGLDQSAGEALVNLLTGSTTPRTGAVRAFGRTTAEIPDSEAWLLALRQYGLLGVRTVLIEQLTVEQNLAIPLTLDVDPLPAPLKAQMGELGTEVGLAADLLARRPAELGALDLQRLARAGARARSAGAARRAPDCITRTRGRRATRARYVADCFGAWNGRGVHHRGPRIRAAGR